MYEINVNRVDCYLIKEFNCEQIFHGLQLQMRIVIQLIESYLKQEIPTILITTDTNKYMFNVPPSFQRYTRDNKIKFPIGANYFFTKATTNTITGLTGLLLTMYDKGASCNSKLYLNDRLFQYMQELRYKMGFKVSPVSYCTWQGRLRSGINNFEKILSLSQKENVVQIFDNMENYINKQIPPKERNNSTVYLNKEHKHFQNEEFKIKPFFIDSKGQEITNYIITPKPLQGKILKEKMQEYGLKAGKQIAELIKLGKKVINGRQIFLEELKQPDSKSPNIIILHYNCKQSIKEILSNEIFKAYMSDKQNFTYCLVHIVQDPDILKSQEYKLLINQFDLQVEHLIYNRSYKNTDDSVQDVMNLSPQLQMVSSLSKMFPMCMPNIEEKFKAYITEHVCNQANIQEIFPQHKVKIYKKCYQMVVSPKKAWGYKFVAQNQLEKKKMELNNVGQYELLNLPLEEQMAEKVKIADPKIIFLGTGSMKPSKYRNVSSILVQMDSKNSIVLDCGEGTHIQIAQHFGFEKFQESILKIRIIFISHIHSDHNLGILDLISQRNKVLQKNKLNPSEHILFLILPANVVPWFDSFCRNIQDLKYGCQVVFIQSLRNEDYNMEGTMSKENAFNKICPTKSQMVQQSQEKEEQEPEEEQLTFNRPEWVNVLHDYANKQKQVLERFSAYLKEINILDFKPCPVIHCPQSYGIVFTHKSKIKLSYSGDTRPCQEFAKAAYGSTIMIHEATFGDDLQSNAYSHFHSTVGEAIDIGMASKSWKTALTHFSQRYKSASDIVDPRMYKTNQKKHDYAKDHTIVCYDHLQVSVSTAHLMPYYTRILALAMPKDGKQ